MKTIIRFKNGKEEVTENNFPLYTIEEQVLVLNLVDKNLIVMSEDVPLDLVEQVTWVNDK